jgi:RNA 3'-terminal phosphate cyclase
MRSLDLREAAHVQLDALEVGTVGLPGAGARASVALSGTELRLTGLRAGDEGAFTVTATVTSAVTAVARISAAGTPAGGATSNQMAVTPWTVHGSSTTVVMRGAWAAS